MTFTDYEFYTKKAHGKLSEDQYNSVVQDAAAEIIRNTRGHAFSVADEEMLLNIKMCECRLVDVLYSYSQIPAGVSSVNNDGYSLTYGGRNSNDGLEGEGDSILRVLRRWLREPENLLYRGVEARCR